MPFLRDRIPRCPVNAGMPGRDGAPMPSVQDQPTMSLDTTPSPAQVGFSSLVSHPVVPTTVATVCMLLAMLLPLVTVSVTLGGGVPFLSIPISGNALLGVAGWLVFLVFLVAVATRIVPAAMPYRSLVDTVALAAWAVLLAWALYQAASGLGDSTAGAANPFGGGAASPFDGGAASPFGAPRHPGQPDLGFGGGTVNPFGAPRRPGQPDLGASLRQAARQAVSVTPAIGAAFLIGAGPLAWVGARRAKRASVA